MIFFPNAKINLGLNVVEKRSDGYHNIESLFLPVGIRDGLEFVEAPDLNKPFEWHSSGRVIDGSPEDNICIKALMLMRNQYQSIPPLKIHLHKFIPFGAGLGGGSADGAFMLNALNNTFNLGASKEQLKAFATQLGADCTFFIDNVPSFATGIGNVLEPFSVDLKGYQLVVVVPNIHVSTPLAYKSMVPKYPAVRLREALKEPIENWKSLIINDFELPVFEKHPEIKALKERLYHEGAVYASMSGSGSAVFGLFKNPIEFVCDGIFCHSEILK